MMYNGQKANSGLKTFDLCEFCGQAKQGMEMAEKHQGVQYYKPLLIHVGKRPWVKHADFCSQNPNQKMHLIPCTPGSCFYREDPQFCKWVPSGKQPQSNGKKMRSKKPLKGTFADAVADNVPIAQVFQFSVAESIEMQDKNTQTPTSLFDALEMQDQNTQTPTSLFDALAEIPNDDKNGSPLPKRRLFEKEQSPLTARESFSLESSPYKSSPLKRFKTSQVDFPQSPFAILQSPNTINASCTRLPSTSDFMHTPASTSDFDEELENFYDPKFKACDGDM